MTMKMMSSTSTTSTRGVMLMSLLYSPPPPPTDIDMETLSLGPRSGLAALLLLFRDEADVLEAGVLAHLEDFLDVAVLEPLVGLDDDLGRRVALVELVERRLELRLGLRLGIVDVVLDGRRVLNRDELLLGPFGLLVRVVRLGDLDAHALLEHGRDDHE